MKARAIVEVLGRMRGRSAAETAAALAAVYREKQRAVAEAPGRGTVAPPTPADGESARAYRGLRRWAAWYEQLVRIQGGLVDRLFAVSSAAPEDDADARVDAELGRLFAHARRLVYKHPVAAQAAFAALVAEGRSFARTPEGARYEAALARSPVFDRAVGAFEMLTGSALLDDPRIVLPSSYLDMLVQAAAIEDLAPYLAGLITGSKGDRGRDR